MFNGWGDVMINSWSLAVNELYKVCILTTMDGMLLLLAIVLLSCTPSCLICSIL